jgi:hypothetical protein
MHVLKKAAFAAAMVLAPATAANAQGFGGEVDVARAQGDWGAELGIGYQFNLGPIAIRPIGGGFIHQADGYYRDNFSNGQSRCRDESNGQFATDESCVDVDWYAKAEAAFVTRSGFEIGGGARFSSEKTRPYGLVALQVSRNIKIHAAGGSRFIAAGARLGF